MPPPAAAQRPDILLVVLDSVRADRTSPYGYAPAATPALAELAAEGSVFENAYANSNWTAPSLATILTGLRPFSHGLVGRLDSLAPGIPTAQALLSRAGYETAVFFTGLPGEDAYGLTRGFKSVVSAEGDRPMKQHADAALNWAAGLPPEKNFFILLHGNDAHYPYRCASGTAAAQAFPEVDSEFVRYFSTRSQADVPEQDLAKFKKAAAYRGNAAFLSRVSAAYDRCISRQDEALKGLLRGLNASGRPLLTIVTSDHGEMLGEHDLLGHGMGFFEPLVRVPLLLRFPGGPASVREAGLAEHADILPTVCAAAGLGCPSGLDGRNLAAPAPERPRRWAAAGHLRKTERPLALSAAFSQGKKKLVRNRANWQLYDLAADPRENVNLAAARPGEFFSMAASYLEFTGAGPVLARQPPEAKNGNCFRNPGAGAAKGGRFIFSPGPKDWKMSRNGFSAVYSSDGNISCLDQGGRRTMAAPCVPAAAALLNCVEDHRFVQKAPPPETAEKLKAALRAAGYLP
ncbi:MAG: sulfatase [Elusimicrobiales bacterium]|nr:sulfatase [Elusimicrobiales bacterium]